MFILLNKLPTYSSFRLLRKYEKFQDNITKKLLIYDIFFKNDKKLPAFIKKIEVDTLIINFL